MQKVTIVAIGAGNRMNAYAEYIRMHPEEVELVAVVDPNEARRQHYATSFKLLPARCFASWEDFLSGPKVADAVFLCTPDHLHYRPAMMALEKGYHILLEKPIAQSWQQCLDIVQKARENNCIVGVCHVLRYHPYFRKIREVIDSGKLGEMITLNHQEEVGIERMTHAFVRGLWRREEETNPMILSKACHDLDLLVWLTGKKCREVSSFGSLKWFKESNAPAGSTARCTDGCLVEKTCPYSAIHLYYRQKRWLRHFDLPEEGDADEVILKELREGPYGRCVYRCDNDVVDHQVVSMRMENDVTVNFSMDAFTREGARKTHIMFSGGELSGNEKSLTIKYFQPGLTDEVYDFTDSSGECNYHGGADLYIVGDFIRSIREKNPDALLTNIETSLESHRIAFEIEKKRLQSH
ncbi:Gfo/Idh/MocA family protein [Culturomica massiliensis]|uniref:Gfo/Idh/MocA family protein n=1 Tax=Culturomica massiliensis TaxID=1841857 RepID=UPI001D0C4E05|nr:MULTISPECIES: Gfo/Idh/MocA family oxidoreductase [Odoribacteraceae]